jgi:hypothetical protein
VHASARPGLGRPLFVRGPATSLLFQMSPGQANNQAQMVHNAPIKNCTIFAHLRESRSVNHCVQSLQAPAGEAWQRRMRDISMQDNIVMQRLGLLVDPWLSGHVCQGMEFANT